MTHAQWHAIGGVRRTIALGARSLGVQKKLGRENKYECRI